VNNKKETMVRMKNKQDAEMHCRLAWLPRKGGNEAQEMKKKNFA
jgi:hypothetical protein